MRSRRVAARARRIAVIAASVPDETSRTCSTDGTASTISSASSTSAAVAAPNVVPEAAARPHGLDGLAVGVAPQQRTPRRTQSTKRLPSSVSR